MTKQRRLGRGLEALLGVPLDQDLAPEVELTDDGSPSTIPIRPDAVAEGKSSKSYAPIDGQIAELNVYEIDNNPFQPRRSFHPDEIASLADLHCAIASLASAGRGIDAQVSFPKVWL